MDRTIQLWMDHDVIEQLEALRPAYGDISRSALIRMAIRQFLDRQAGK